MHLDYALIIQEITALISVALIGFVAARVWRKWRPSVRPQDERELREALLLAEKVFQHVSDEGGFFGHPWIINEREWQEDEITSTLHGNAARISRNKLTQKVQPVIDNLKTVRRASHKPPPSPPRNLRDPNQRSNTSQRDAWYAQYQKQADIATVAAEAGIQSAKDAIAILVKISKE
jgi:hypothetical protein